MCSADIFLGFLALLFPPLPVWVKRGICSADSVINILLCVLGYIPGLIHAWYIIAKFPEPDYDYDSLPQGDQGRVTYVFVHGAPRPQPQPQSKPQNQQGNMNYGTTNEGNASSGSAPQQQDGGAGEGSSAGGHAPPSYAQVVAGDNKVQSEE